MSGRPKKVINWEEFDKLCALQATLEDIASWFSVSTDTIERCVKREKKMNFAEYFKIKRGRGKVGLRRKQYEVAMTGNIPMLIWLGKQYLGQTDKQDLNQNHSGGVTIKVVKVDGSRNAEN